MGMATQDHGAEYGEGEFPDARQVEFSTEVWMEQDSEDERAGANSGTVDPKWADDVHRCFEGEDNVGGTAVGAAASQNLATPFHEPGPVTLTLPLDSPATVRRERGRKRGCQR
jgi:hypothetical protein